MSTRFFTSNASNRFDAPELSLMQKKTRRAETLLLDVPHGFFLSSLSNYLSIPEVETQVIIEGFGAQCVNGFWIHPHYIKNLNINSLNPALTLARKPVNLKAVKAALSENKNIDVSDLMKCAGIFRIDDLIGTLKKIVDGEAASVNIQITASRYLFSKLNIKYRVLYHN